jgi:hypothetical protein
LRDRGARSGPAALVADVDPAVVDPEVTVDPGVTVDLAVTVALGGREPVELAPPHPATSTAIATANERTPRILLSK